MTLKGAGRKGLPLFLIERLTVIPKGAGGPNIKPALAEAAVTRNLPQRPHHRVAPTARHRRYDVLPKTARTAQFPRPNV